VRNAEVTIAQQGIVHAELDLVIPGGSSGSIPDHSESILSPNSHSADPTETASAKQTILWRPVNRLPVSNPCRSTVPVQPAPSCGITSASPAWLQPTESGAAHARADVGHPSDGEMAVRAAVTLQVGNQPASFRSLAHDRAFRPLSHC
jgi:hypothetical protein